MANALLGFVVKLYLGCFRLFNVWTLDIQTLLAKVFMNLKVTRNNPEIEFEDVFLDKFAKSKKQTEPAVGRLEVPLKKSNFLLLLLLGFLVFGALSAVSFSLQITGKSKFSALAQQNRFIISFLTAERGGIYDANNQALVLNEPSFDLWLDKAKWQESPGKENILKKVAAIVEKESGELLSLIEKIDDEHNQALLLKNLSHQALVILESRKQELPGFLVKKRIVRHYSDLTSLSHLLGYLGKISAEEYQQSDYYDINDYLGREGLEKVYETALRENKGRMKIERDAAGNELRRQMLSSAQSGKDLILHLDLNLQRKAEEALKKVLDEIGSQKGVVVALNPENGGVLASVSLPGFDNNLFSKGISEKEFAQLNQDPNNPQLNRVVAGLYPTGSAIKPLIALAALEEGIITEQTQLYCPLELCIPHKYTGEGECFSDWVFHGWTNVKKALAESVNPFFYIIGGGYQAPDRESEFFDERLPDEFDGLGIDKIGEYLRRFGLGSITGIDLPGESKGRVPSPEWKEQYFDTKESQKWYLGDTYNLSIGQGYLLVTPLQMAVAFSCLANNGVLFEPQLVKQIVSDKGEGIASSNFLLSLNNSDEPSPQPSNSQEPVIVRQGFISQENLDIVKQGMRQAVASPAGSAYSLNALRVEAAAKTGTAEVYPNREIYHNWIGVFAPYESPEIVLIVLIEEVEGLQKAAQNVALDILQWYFTGGSTSKH